MKTFEFNSLAKGGKSIVTLNENSLTISRPGVVSKLSHGFSGDKTIMYNQITSIQIKKAGISRGYIQFSISGTREAKSGLINGKIDENIIYFDSTFNNKKVNNQALEIKEIIESYNANSNKTIIN